MKSDYLAALIGSMSNAEKRYFTDAVLSKDKSEGNKTTKLYNAYLKALRNGSEPKIGSLAMESGYPRLRNYLYNAILKSIGECNHGKSINRQLDNYLHEIDILTGKGLYTLALKRVREASKIAVRAGKLDHEYKLIRLERGLQVAMGGFSKSRESIRVMDARKQELLQKRMIEAQMDEIYNEYHLALFVNPKYDPNTDHGEFLTDVRSNFNEQTEHTQVIYCMLHTSIYMEQDKIAEAGAMHHEALALFESKTGSMKDETSLDPFNIRTYAMALHNYLRYLKITNEIEQFFKTLEKLKRLKPKTKRARDRIFLNLAITESDFYLDSAMFDEGMRYIEENITTIGRISSEIERAELLFFNTAYLSFIAGDYKLANKYNNKVMYGHTYQILVKTAHFINVLIQIELGKMVHSEYCLDTIKNKYKLGEFDKLLFRSLNGLISGNKRYFAKNKKLLEAWVQDPVNQNDWRNLDRYFDFTAWLNARSEQRNYKLVLISSIHQRKMT